MVIGWAVGVGASTLFNPPMFEEIESNGFGFMEGLIWC